MFNTHKPASKQICILLIVGLLLAAFSIYTFPSTIKWRTANALKERFQVTDLEHLMTLNYEDKTRGYFFDDSKGYRYHAVVTNVWGNVIEMKKGEPFGDK